MNYLSYFKTVCLSIFLVGCATSDAIKLSGPASIYKCVNPKQKTVIAMHWDTCPLFGWKPQHEMINQNWEVISIVSPENNSYYNGQKEIQHKLNKNKRDCSWPSKISELIDLEDNSKIYIENMYRYTNPSFEGVAFSGYVEVSGQRYNVSYRGRLDRADQITGYNFENYFESCNENL